ncbi:hypothetical protein [Pectobacterium odoriferum]|uniref:hypothetical protein n=1 Tax=Pectobacterium odoriferum TaxID=78398 RepID=UPI00052B06C6|nr:hypothetical protein [Pectobacterium odoriferum]AIU88336.1 hypothetical protein BCS7_09440 [Pectobacterium odoriferum]POE20483.1 hypothetical protein BV918_02085 [Pectobacterium odoriferum]POE37203.1 hypothetical protein BV922_02080 [Pectobacterium odoriferum]
MSAPRPLPKTNELLRELFPSIEAGVNFLDEFTLRRIIREAQKLPDADQAYCVEGLARMISGDTDRGIELCEKAISINPYEKANWANYLRLLRSLFIYSKELVVMRGVLEYLDSEMLSKLITYSVIWCNLDLLRSAINKAKEMGVEVDNKNAESIISLQERFPSDMADIEKLAGLVMEIAEEEKILSSHSTVTEDVHGYLAYGFRVNTDDPNYLFSLNDRLADMIIDAGLATVDSVAFFEAGVDE